MLKTLSRLVVCRISVRFCRPITFHRIAFDQPIEGIDTIQYEMSPARQLFRACIARFPGGNKDERKTKTDCFPTHIFSSGARDESLEKLRHFLPITFRLSDEKGRLYDPNGQENVLFADIGKELCQIEPKMRRFCLSTTEIREQL
jgi:hypothetical protein